MYYYYYYYYYFVVITAVMPAVYHDIVLRSNACEAIQVKCQVGDMQSLSDARWNLGLRLVHVITAYVCQAVYCFCGCYNAVNKSNAYFSVRLYLLAILNVFFFRNMWRHLRDSI